VKFIQEKGGEKYETKTPISSFTNFLKVSKAIVFRPQKQIKTDIQEQHTDKVKGITFVALKRNLV
jgi:hypothetical protein